MSSPAWTAELVLKNTPAEVYFSPRGGAQDAVVREIGRARKTILVTETFLLTFCFHLVSSTHAKREAWP